MNLHKEKLYEKAIEAAVDSRWDEAVNLHEQIIQQDPEYIDSLLGIAFAYLQKDDYKKAATFYRKALKIEPTNQIAKKQPRESRDTHEERYKEH
ncbi:MAG: Tetratricopeptide repeat protein [Microgenomates bacterium OLB22]|nr:MAG: Tetratricopeptide repeat protein [Microgenomates bacterium OLB22]